MDNLNEKLEELFAKKVWTEQECLWFLDLLKQKPISEFQEIFSENFIANLSKISPADTGHASALLRQIHERTGMPALEETPVRKLAPMRWVRWVAAAAVLAAMFTGTYFLFVRKPEPQIAKVLTQQERFKNDVAPGGNKAVLTLGNGSQIMLDSAHNGVLAQQGNSKILKTDSGKLAYKITNEKPAEIVYNTLTTPKGGQYQLTLPDGSQVWLNAASSIKYPTAFSGNERKVEITGEAYFEVAKNAAKPFYVHAENMGVKVLGTHFNINAYADEPSINTTLLEGKVEVNGATVLAPGQQSQLRNGQIKINNSPDIDEVMAWKNGRFRFDDADITTIMRQVERWYNVEIVYDGNAPSYPFVAKISREVPVSELLKLLELTDLVHFKIEGNKITVMK